MNLWALAYNEKRASLLPAMDVAGLGMLAIPDAVGFVKKPNWKDALGLAGLGTLAAMPLIEARERDKRRQIAIAAGIPPDAIA